MPDMLKRLRQSLVYWRLVLAEAFHNSLAWGLRHIIGGGIAIAVLVSQIHYRVFDTQLKGRLLSIFWPYGVVLAVGYLFHVGRAAWQLHDKQEDQIVLLKRELDSLSAMPEVTATWIQDEWQLGPYSRPPGFKLRLQNTGRHLAVNITALAIELPIPETTRTRWKETISPNEEIKIPTKWPITFSTIDRLVPGDAERDLSYTVDNLSPNPNNDIGLILREFIKANINATFVFAVVFSNVGRNLKTWHAHYESTFRPGRIDSRFLGFEEVAADGTCSRC